eukprot:CAMPEP_0181217316 /NCGR_PEP_ID=MMETSP1096-20121128/27081_1 /TAXON_ID=156174 ORGANISM="Chrysochromulina ericina, Strain CCMP281" /NCGR_SAMPLE_ID=MMETSP1096 /ASSEMBLY_ACC=CAM_ASM_000453 /LENGTH=108 /DNA_ID=CAMNT_0023309429 /DNA_START=230 /DNA_END=553 /DNA_ORIENTATION=-
MLQMARCSTAQPRPAPLAPLPLDLRYALCFLCDLHHHPPREHLMARHNRCPITAQACLIVPCEIANWPVMVTQQPQTQILQQVAGAWRRESRALPGASDVEAVTPRKW